MRKVAEPRTRLAGSVLALLVASSCGGRASLDSERGARGSSGRPSEEPSAPATGGALSGSSGVIASFGGIGGMGQSAIGGSFPDVGGEANLAGEGGSGGTADP